MSEVAPEASVDPPPSLPADPPEALPPRIRRLVLGGMVVLTVVALLARAFAPYLLVHHPLLLVALNPDASLMVLVAPSVDLGSLIAVAAPRRILNMAITYGMGAIYGRAAVDWAKRKYPWLAGFIDRVDRVFSRHGVLVLLFLPVYSLCGLAGATRLPFWRFLLAISPGQVVWAVATFYLGDSLSAWINPFIDWLSRHVAEATVACVAAVVLYQLVSRLRRKRDEAPSS